MDSGVFLQMGTVPYLFTEALYAIGVSILSSHMKSAFTYIVEGTKKLNGGRYSSETDTGTTRANPEQAFAFVTGSGLDLVIKKFGLEVDPSDFRESFYDMVEYWKRKKSR